MLLGRFCLKDATLKKKEFLYNKIVMFSKRKFTDIFKLTESAKHAWLLHRDSWVAKTYGVDALKDKEADFCRFISTLGNKYLAEIRPNGIHNIDKSDIIIELIAYLQLQQDIMTGLENKKDVTELQDKVVNPVNEDDWKDIDIEKFLDLAEVKTYPVKDSALVSYSDSKKYLFNLK